MSRVVKETKGLPIASIDAGERLRPISEAGVEAVMESVRTLGRFTDPIQVRLVGRGDAQRHVLMAGAHRLEAAKRLGEDGIWAVVWECNDDEAALIEVDDNLARAELSLVELCVFSARRKATYLRLHPETARGAAGASSRWSDMQTTSMSFASVIAEKRGISKRHAERLVSIGERLSLATVKALQSALEGAKIDLKTLTDLAKIEGEEQAEVARAIAAKEAANVRAAQARVRGEAAAPAPRDPVDDARAALLDRFDRAPMAAKRAFLQDLWARHAQLMADEADKALGGPAE